MFFHAQHSSTKCWFLKQSIASTSVSAPVPHYIKPSIKPSQPDCNDHLMFILSLTSVPMTTKNYFLITKKLYICSLIWLFNMFFNLYSKHKYKTHLWMKKTTMLYYISVNREREQVYTTETGACLTLQQMLWSELSNNSQTACGVLDAFQAKMCWDPDT